MTAEERALALCAKMGWHFEDGTPHKGTLAELTAEFAAVEHETLERAAGLVRSYAEPPEWISKSEATGISREILALGEAK